MHVIEYIGQSFNVPMNLHGRKLDGAVARAMGYKCACDDSRSNCAIHSDSKKVCPAYSSSAQAVTALERSVEQNGLDALYIAALARVAFPLENFELIFNSSLDCTHEFILRGGNIFDVLCATPEQRCQAFVGMMEYLSEAGIKLAMTNDGPVG